MSWRVDRSRGPEWSGTDSIYNTKSELRWLYLIGGIAAMLISFAMLGSAGDSDVDKGLSGVVVLLMLTPSIGMAAYGAMLFPKWLGGGWRLTANASYLYFRGEENWGLNVNHITSVEVGRTVDWTPSRPAGFKDAPVSQYEWQVFLYLTNGSRRVIYSVNADRESAATLAASIKSWVDGQRVTLAERFPADRGPVREGFAL